MKQRRVGTFTLGLTLILIGIMVPVMLIFKENAILLLQFAPIVLIFMGIEVLIYAFRFKEDKLKYDGVSIFLVIMITLISIGVATIAPMADIAINNHNLIEQKIDDGEKAIEDALKSNNLKARVDVYNTDYDDVWHGIIKADNLDMGATLYYHWDIKEKEPTKEEIADKFLGFIKSVNYDLESMDISVIYKDHAYADVDLNKRDFDDITKEKIVENITFSREDVE